tara:strand:- start:67 stop:240 length:174 start_codon:yes stop_codon:yes gene_type:complete
MRLTAVRNRMSAAAAEPRVPAPKTRQSIRLDEVRRLADRGETTNVHFTEIPGAALVV